MKTKVLAALLVLTFGMNVNAQQKKNETLKRIQSDVHHNKKNDLLLDARKEAAIINELLAIGADVSPFYSPEEVKEFIVDYEKFSPDVQKIQHI